MILANSFATTIALIWLICSLGVAFLPEPSLMITKLVMHSQDMSVMGAWQVTIQSFILGGIISVVFGWVVGYVLGLSIEYFGKK